MFTDDPEIGRAIALAAIFVAFAFGAWIGRVGGGRAAYDRGRRDGWGARFRGEGRPPEKDPADYRYMDIPAP